MTCTRCGLCLESCPTYTLWGAEPDSPRGRITLIEDALAPGGAVTPAMAVHVDRCLGCMACMSACPEEVAYADLLASARAAGVAKVFAIKTTLEPHRLAAADELIDRLDLDVVRRCLS